MSALVTRLRQAAHTLETDSQAWEQLAVLPALQAGQRRTVAVLAEAADEIERLRAEVATLRHQLANALDSLKYECDQRLQIERRYCPCCGHEPVDGHNAACGLDACLGGRYE